VFASIGLFVEDFMTYHYACLLIPMLLRATCTALTRLLVALCCHQQLLKLVIDMDCA
jgi:hypothetical protein